MNWTHKTEEADWLSTCPTTSKETRHSKETSCDDEEIRKVVKGQQRSMWWGGRVAPRMISLEDVRINIGILVNVQPQSQGHQGPPCSLLGDVNKINLILFKFIIGLQNKQPSHAIQKDFSELSNHYLFYLI